MYVLTQSISGSESEELSVIKTVKRTDNYIQRYGFYWEVVTILFDLVIEAMYDIEKVLTLNISHDNQNKFRLGSMIFDRILIILPLFSWSLINLNVPAEISINEKIKNANYIEIHFLKGKPPSIYKTNRTIDLNYLKTLITNAKNDSSLNCDTTGKIVYFKDKMELTQVYFCSKLTGSKFNLTGAIAFKTEGRNIKSKLNYDTGMLLDEVFYKLNKSK